MNRLSVVRVVLCSCLGLSAALDFFSFAIKPQFHSFDMSALTVWTGNIWLIFLVKFSVIAALCYLLLFVKASQYWHYLYIMMSVYLIIFQVVGFISNRQVAEANPPPESAPSKEVRLATGFNFAIIWAYYPMAFSMLCFWLFNLGWKAR